MKKCNKLLSTILAIIMVLSTVSVSFVSFAAEAKEDGSKAIELKTANVSEAKTDDGYLISIDLMQKIPDSSDNIDTRSIGWILVGNASFRLRLSPDNGIGYADWRVTLTNNDFIKAVSGTLVLEKDVFGPINPNYDSVDVYEDYFSAQYKIASGCEDFYFVEDNYSQDIIFKWRSFKITGVINDYYVTNGDKQAKVKDFI